MNRLKIKFILSVCLGLFFLATASCGAFAQQTPKGSSATEDPMAQLQKFNQFYRYLMGTYVDTLNNRDLVEKAITEVLTQLDPHSAYLSAEEMVGVKETFEGSFSGIGIEFNVLNDTIIVVNVIAGGPSQQVGLLPNDRIVKVNGQVVVGTKQMEVPKILRGPKGTVAELEVVRAGVAEPLDFRVVRDNIPINTVDAAYLLAPKTGYIRVNRFANNTYREFVEAYEKMGPLDALVVDLRSNGGGLLDQAIDMSNFFLPQGSVIVSTEGMRVPADKAVARKAGPFTKGKVIVLTNETSASGSEIVAGAIQDWDRGLIIGRRTFGKGLVQRQFPLQDGSALRLTVARYHTPTGRVIQRPYVNGQVDEYEAEFVKRFSDQGTESPVDSTKVYKTLRSGRTVYGGGGVSPDITVQMDTTAYTDYWGNLIRKGILLEYVVQHMDRNRTSLTQSYPTIDLYMKNFRVDDKTLADLLALARKKGVEPKEEDLARSASMIRSQLKALIAQKLWGMNEYFMVANSEDDAVISKVLDVLQNWDHYAMGIVSE